MKRDPTALRDHVDFVRQLTAEQKLNVASSLRNTAWELSAAGIRHAHPELPEEEVQQRVRQIFLRAAT